MMKSSVLVQVLSTINKSEHSNLIKFAESPFFTDKKDIVVFLKVLLIYYPFDKQEFTKEDCFAQLYPQKEYNDSKMRQLMAATKKLIEQYLVVNQVQEDAYLEEKILTKYYRKHDLEIPLQAKIKNLEKNIKKHPYLDEKFYYEQYELSWEKTGVLSKEGSRNRDKNFNKLYGQQLLTTIECLNKFYFFKVLELYNLRYLHSVLFDDTVEMGFVENILEVVLKNQSYESTVPINMFAHSLYFLRDLKSEDHFHNFRQLLDENVDKIEPVIASNFYRTACSYTIRQIREGKEEFFEILFQLYNTMLQQNLILIEGVFPIGTFKNIVNLSLQLNKHKWVEEFIHAYHTKLAGENPNDILNFVLSLLEFDKKNYDKVLDLLNQVEAIKDVYYNIQAKRLFLKVFYEQDEIDLLYAHMNSFKVYIHRNKLISADQKSMNGNFINLLMRLVELVPNQEKKYLKLKDTIINNKDIYEQEWLCEKVGILSTVK